MPVYLCDCVDFSPTKIFYMCLIGTLGLVLGIGIGIGIEAIHIYQYWFSNEHTTFHDHDKNGLRENSLVL